MEGYENLNENGHRKIWTPEPDPAFDDDVMYHKYLAEAADEYDERKRAEDAEEMFMSPKAVRLASQLAPVHEIMETAVGYGSVIPEVLGELVSDPETYAELLANHQYQAFNNGETPDIGDLILDIGENTPAFPVVMAFDYAMDNIRNGDGLKLNPEQVGMILGTSTLPFAGKGKKMVGKLKDKVLERMSRKVSDRAKSLIGKY